MPVWALADLHLSFGITNKKMDIFGEQWHGWTEKIKENWCKYIQEDDLVLVAGDISWAMHTEDALADLNWIDQLPGTKLILKGNHDYWWSSRSKVEKILPSSIKLIQNDTFTWNGITIGGARLWDTPEYDFNAYIEFKENPKASALSQRDQAERIFDRELQRLELSLKGLDPNAHTRIAMTHYPPIGSDLQDSRASALLEKYKIDICVFGHLHNLKKGISLFGEKNGIRYLLTSCDYLDFIPIRICDG